MSRKQVLGRGLDVLIPDVDSSKFGSSDFFYCDIDTIRANPYQPRRVFAKQELKALSDSIKANGVIQPLIVRSVSGGYELIVGERRWRSCHMAGLKRVPVVVRDVSAREMLEMALIENTHREDLNPLEKAEAYYRLMDEFGLTQEKVAKRVGQNRSTVANFLRLRSLPGEIRDDIVNNTLSMGHARALLGAETPAQQRVVWRQIVSKNLSVRAAETLIKKLKTGESGKHQSGASSSEDVYLQSVADDLTQLFATKVRIVRRGKKGRLEIEFYGNEDLDRLVTRLKAL